MDEAFNRLVLNIDWTHSNYSIDRVDNAHYSLQLEIRCMELLSRYARFTRNVKRYHLRETEIRSGGGGFRERRGEITVKEAE